MIRHLAVIAAAALTAAVPLLPQTKGAPIESRPWPTSFEGRKLTPIAPGPGDALLARGFPGRVARFSDGRRQIVLRQVARPTRLLHPPRDCFAALGYRIEPLPMQSIAGGRASCFAAVRGQTQLNVCERIADAAGNSYPDVPSWFWPAMLGTGRGPWLAAMTVERSG